MHNTVIFQYIQMITAFLLTCTVNFQHFKKLNRYLSPVFQYIVYFLFFLFFFILRSESSKNYDSEKIKTVLKSPGQGFLKSHRIRTVKRRITAP